MARRQTVTRRHLDIVGSVAVARLWQERGRVYEQHRLRVKPGLRVRDLRGVLRSRNVSGQADGFSVRRRHYVLRMRWEGGSRWVWGTRRLRIRTCQRDRARSLPGLRRG